MQKAKELFVNIMGFIIHEENPEFGWCEVRCDEKLIGICESKISEINKEIIEEFCIKPGQNAVMTFTVDDLIMTVDAMKKRGVKFGPISELPGRFKVASFVDFDGNQMQLYQMYS